MVSIFVILPWSIELTNSQVNGTRSRARITMTFTCWIRKLPSARHIPRTMLFPSLIYATPTHMKEITWPMTAVLIVGGCQDRRPPCQHPEGCPKWPLAMTSQLLCLKPHLSAPLTILLLQTEHHSCHRRNFPQCRRHV